MTFFFHILVSGVVTGAIYGLIAVGYSITFTTMKVLNFALGMWVMLGGLLTYTLVVPAGLNLVVALLGVMLAIAALGLIAEQVSVHPFVRASSDAWVMSTLAVGLLLINVAELVWGQSPLPVPPYAGESVIMLAGIPIFPQQILILAITLVVFLALDFFYYRTLLGKAFRAVAANLEVAGLMGIDTRGISRLAYVLACALAGFAGFIVVPLTLAEPQMGTVLGLKAFAIAIIAGLGAPRGILICGVAYGAIEALISGYLYTGVRDILGFSLMILALFLKPEGLFGRAEEERA